VNRAALIAALAMAPFTARHAAAQDPSAEDPPAEDPPAEDPYEDEPETEEVIDVTATAPPRPPEPSKTGMTSETARRTAGSEGDPTKVVRNLPGVARPALGSGDVIVWGADAADTRVFVDGIPVPALYHFGGVRGIVPSEAVGSIDLVPGAFGPEHGRALGGLVEVRLLEPIRPGVHGTVAVDTLDAAAEIELNDQSFSTFAAGRYGYLDRLVAAVAPDVAPLYVVPRYFDGVASLNADVGRARLGARVLMGRDEVERTTASAEPVAQRTERRERTFVRSGVPLSYVHPDGAETEALAFWGYDHASQQSRFGELPLTLDTRAWVWGARADCGSGARASRHRRRGSSRHHAA
jgi:hypothetical protein